MPETKWWKNAKIYELYVDKFAGDFRGLTSRLPYLSRLGINAIHLLPFCISGGVDEGYDVTDYRAIRPELGTIEDFRAFTETAHSMGIRIIADLVLNHTSTKHPWYVEATISKGSPKHDYFIWRDLPRGFEGATNGVPDIKPSNWIYEPQNGQYYFSTFFPGQADVNWDNPAIEAEFLAIMDYWVALGVDGFRLDAAAHLVKREGTRSKGLPETHAIIKRIRKHIDANYPDVIILPEACQSVEETRVYFGDGDECHMVYHFPLMQAMWLSIMEGDGTRARDIANASFDIPSNCQWATFLRNHDELTTENMLESEREELIRFIDPDMQYPFREASSSSVRVATALAGDDVKIREAFSLLYSLPGAPIMYYGDEIKMRNLPPQSGALDSRIFVRGEFDWQEAEKQMADSTSTWHFIAELIRRRSVSSVTKESGATAPSSESTISDTA